MIFSGGFCKKPAGKPPNGFSDCLINSSDFHHGQSMNSYYESIVIKPKLYIYKVIYIYILYLYILYIL